MSIARNASRLFDTLDNLSALRYFVQSPCPSIASYKICSAIHALGVRPQTVLDVGANHGQFAGAAAWWFPGVQITSFEPSPAVFPKLKRNTNRLRGVTAVQSALGDRVGELDFYESDYSHASSALPQTERQRGMQESVGRVNKISVPVATLDRFASAESWASPVLLKLDVQGFEKQVLQGAAKSIRRIDYLLFECSFVPLYVGETLFMEMYEYVRGLGFDLIAPVGCLEDRKHSILQADLLWVRRE